MTLNHLSKRIKEIGTDYLSSVLPNAVLTGFVPVALLGCVALKFPLWQNRFSFTSQNGYTLYIHMH